MKKTAVLVGFAVLLSIFSPLPFPTTGNALDLSEEVSTDEVIFTRGIISKIYAENMQIGVRPLKGKLIIISIDPDTLLEGFSRLDELGKKQQVKIWYSIENDGNKALKIKKMMDLGC